MEIKDIIIPNREDYRVAIPDKIIQASANPKKYEKIDAPFASTQIGAAFSQGYRESAPRQFDIASYRKLLTNVNSNLPIDVLNQERALAQSGWRLLGNSMAQLGGTILGDTIAGIGSVIGFGRTGWEMIHSILDSEYEPDWDKIMKSTVSGAIQSFGTNISEGIRDFAPIYQTKRAMEGGFGGGFGDATWWASMFPTVGSAAASMVPIFGGLRLLNMAGKFAQLARGGSLIGKTVRGVGNVLTNRAVQGIVGTLQGANLDIMLEITHDYDNQFQYALDKGFSEEEAKQFAAEYASTAYKDAWLYGLAFNALEMSVILKGANKTSRSLSGVDKQLRRNAPKQALEGPKFTGISEEVKNLSKWSILRSRFDKTGDFLKMVAGEGLEEMRVDYALQEGVLKAKEKLNIYDPRIGKTHSQKIVDFVSDSRNWDSFIWGAAGGMVMYGAKGMLNSIANPKAFRDHAQRQYEQTSNVLQDLVNTIATYDGDLSLNIDTKEDPTLTVLNPLFNALGQANAFGYAENLLNEISKLSDAEIADAYGENKKELIQNLIKEVKIAKQFYDKSKNVNRNIKYQDGVALNVANIYYNDDYYRRKISELETERDRLRIINNDYSVELDARLKELDSNYDELVKKKSSYNSELTALMNSRNELSEAIDSIQKERDKLDKQHDKYRSEKRENDLKIKNLKNEIKKTRSSLQNLNVNKFESKEAFKKRQFEIKKEITDLNKQVKETTLENIVVKNQRDSLESSISYLDSEIKVNNQKKEYLQREIDIQNENVAVIDKHLKDYIEKHPETFGEYFRIKKEYEERIDSPDERVKAIESAIDDLRKIRQPYKAIINNEKKYSKLIDSEYEKIDKRHQEEVGDQKNVVEELKKEQAENEDLTKELEHIPDSEETVGDFTYVKDENGNILSVILNEIKYDIGSRLRKSKIESIEKTESGIRINLEDNTFIEEKEFKDINEGQENISIKTNVLKSVSKFTSDYINNHFLKAIDDMVSLIESKYFRKDFLSKNISLSVSERRFNTIRNLFDNFVSYRTNQTFTEEEKTKVDEALKNLEVYVSHVALAYNFALIYDYINKTFKTNLSKKSANINNVFKNDYKSILMSKLAHYMSQLTTVETIEDRFQFRIDANIETILKDIDSIYNSFLDIVDNKFKKEFELDNFDQLYEVLETSYNKFKEKLKTDFNYQYEKLRRISEEMDAEEAMNTASENNEVRKESETPVSPKSDDFLYQSILDLVDSVDEENGTIREDYSENDYRSYITPSQERAFNALRNLISKFKVNNRTATNHKISYRDILDIIYSQPNGAEEVQTLYFPIWRALKNVMNHEYIEELKASIKRTVPQANYEEFFELLDYIRKNTISPVKSIDRKHIDDFDNVTSKFIKGYLKAKTKTKTVYGVKEGTILPVNNIFNSLNKYIDSKYRTVADKIEIDNQEYTAKEIFDAYKKLKSGTVLTTKLSDDKKSLDLFVKINRKLTRIGTLGLDEHLTHNGVPLIKKGAYNNAFGTYGNLSKTLTSFISILSKSDKAFDITREFFKAYYIARGKGELNDSKTDRELYRILSQLEDVGGTKNGEHSAIMNALINLSNYNTEREGVDEINYDAVFAIIQPLFYQAQLELGINQLDTIENSYVDFKNIYESLNDRLYEQYRQTEYIRKTITENPKAKIVISEINKALVSYGDLRTQNNINESFQKETILNGKPAVKLISTQDVDRQVVYSDVTNNERVIDSYTSEHFRKDKANTQFYVEVRFNDNPNGKSYIPVYRSGIDNDTEFSKVAKERTKSALNEIILDRFLTNLTSEKRENIYQATEDFKSDKNREFQNLMDDLSEIFIIGNVGVEVGKIPWFNVGTLFTNEKGKTPTMAKTIRFLSTIQGEWSYGYTIRIEYEYSSDINAPSKIKTIEVSRVRTLGERFKKTTGAAEKVVLADAFTPAALTKSRFINSTGIESKESLSYTINEKTKTVTFRINNNADVSTLLNSSLFEPIIGGLQRNVKTTLNSKDGKSTLAYTYTSKATGRSFGKDLNKVDGVNIVKSFTENEKVFKGKYVSPTLVWGKEQGIYDGPVEFDSIQDFYLDTKALTTNVTPIVNEDTNEVISNYSVDIQEPAIYVKLEHPNAEVIQTDPVQQEDLTEVDVAKDILKSISPSVDSKTGNFIKDLTDKQGLNRDTFEKLGLIFSNTSDEAYNQMRDLYVKVFKKYPIPLYYVTTYEEFKFIINNFKDDSSVITEEELTEMYNSIEGLYIKDSAIVIKDSPKHSLKSIGGTLRHEIQHHIFKKSIGEGLIHIDSINEIVDLLSKVLNKDASLDFSQVDGNNVRNSNGKNTYSNLTTLLNKIITIDTNLNQDEKITQVNEFIAYLFTDKKIANALNVIYFKEGESKTKESVLSRIFDIIMKVLGIQTNKNSVLEEIKHILSDPIIEVTDITAETPQISTSPLPPTGTDERSEDVLLNNDETFDILNLSDDEIDNRDTIQFRLSEDYTSPGRGGERDAASVINPDNSTDNQNNLLSLSDSDEIGDFKESYTDSENLKIC